MKKSAEFMRNPFLDPQAFLKMPKFEPCVFRIPELDYLYVYLKDCPSIERWIININFDLIVEHLTNDVVGVKISNWTHWANKKAGRRRCCRYSPKDDTLSLIFGHFDFEIEEVPIHGTSRICFAQNAKEGWKIGVTIKKWSELKGHNDPNLFKP